MIGVPATGRHDHFTRLKGGPLARTNFNFEKRRKELDKKKKKEAKQLARQEKKARGAGDVDPATGATTEGATEGAIGVTSEAGPAPESGPTL
jgi:hypothetical protein